MSGGNDAGDQGGSGGAGFFHGMHENENEDIELSRVPSAPPINAVITPSASPIDASRIDISTSPQRPHDTVTTGSGTVVGNARVNSESTSTHYGEGVETPRLPGSPCPSPPLRPSPASSPPPQDQQQQQLQEQRFVAAKSHDEDSTIVHDAPAAHNGTLSASGAINSGPTTSTTVPDAAVVSDADIDGILDTAPATFFCAISTDLMRDPVMLMTGQTYERDAIEKWLATQVRNGQVPRCPGTNQPLRTPIVLVPNLALKKAITEWLAVHLPSMLTAEGDIKRSASDVGVKSREEMDRELAIRIQEEEMERTGMTAVAVSNAGATSEAPSADISLTIDSVAGAVMSRDEVAAAARQRTANQIQNINRRLSFGRSTTGANSVSSVIVFPAVVLLHAVMAAIGATTQIDDSENNPLIGPDFATLIDFGAWSTRTAHADSSMWRALSTVFVPPGLLAVAIVVPICYKTGVNMEKRWGSFRLFLLGTIGAVCGCICGALAVPRTDANACATCFYLSILGAFMYHSSVHKPSVVDVSIGMMDRFLIVRVVICVAFGIFPFVGLLQSMVALIFGFFTAAVLIAPPLYNNSVRKQCDAIAVVQFVSAVLVLSVLVLGPIILMKKVDTSSICPTCYRYNCIDTKFWTCRVYPSVS